MKRFFIIIGCLVAIITVVSCNRPHRGTGRAYMPDMVYSVAYETYAPTEERLSKYGAHYNHMPVTGTIARGDAYPYKLKNDSSGLNLAASNKNPLPPLDAHGLTEATRLYLVNCAICHGPKLDGNGPLYKDGNGPFSAKPANLAASVMTEGSMFHVATWGKGQMGSYASQLNTTQRWMIVSYIKSKQSGAGGKDSSVTKTQQPDSIKLTTTKKP